jgi:hypothetical protein
VFDTAPDELTGGTSVTQGVHRRHLRTGVVILLIPTVLAACSNGQAAPAPTPTPTITAAPTPTTTPQPTPTAAVNEDDAHLEQLRASDAFVEYAPHDRARTGQWARFAYDEFTLSTDDTGVRTEWVNKDQLWDELMPAFRDECLLAGPVATRPIWDGQIMIPVGLSPRWSNATTQGRGQFIEASCAFLDTERDEVVELWMGALLKTDAQGRGHVHRSMEFFSVREPSATTYQERDEWVGEQFWTWITQESTS